MLKTEDAMEQRALGNTGLRVSAMGFGCGAVGGLMVRGSAAEQERAVAWAVEQGVTYFDTAPSYGDGVSEANLGRVLKALRPAVVVGTKFNVPVEPGADVAAAVAASLEASLTRLGLDRVDLLQMHNPVGHGPRMVAPEVVSGAVLPALARLREAGKIGATGFTAVGETAAIHAVLDAVPGAVPGAAGIGSAQVPYNLLNPSAGRTVPPGFPAQDYGGTLTALHDAGKGGIVIRALAGGALSGSAARHPTAAATVEPIGSGPDYAADVRRASALRGVAEAAGCTDTIELAIRFAISHPGVSTAMVGLATMAQLEHAVAAASRGRLPDAALAAVRAVQDGWR